MRDFPLGGYKFEKKVAQKDKFFRCAAEKSGKSGSKPQNFSLRGELGQKSGKVAREPLFSETRVRA